MSSGFKQSFETSDCPTPIYIQGTQPYSIVIPLSCFENLDLNLSGSTGVFAILREQYPDGVVIGRLEVPSAFNHSNKEGQVEYYQEYLEIGFIDNLSCTQAVSKRFLVNGGKVPVYRTVSKNDMRFYRIEIDNIHLLGDPTEYHQVIKSHLGRYGTIEHIHVHCIKDGNWYTGKGCVILKRMNDEAKRVFEIAPHKKLKFSSKLYPVRTPIHSPDI